MSSSSLNARYNKVLLDRANRTLRKEVEAVRGQVIILENFDAFQKVLTKLFPNIPKVSSKDAQEAVQKGRNTAANLQKKIAIKNINVISNGLERSGLTKHHTLGQDMFILHTFADALKVKHSILNYLVSQNILSKEQKTLASKSVDRGHGAVHGDAVSKVDVAAAVGSLDKKDREALAVAYEAWAIEKEIEVDYPSLVKIITKAEQIVTKKGKLRASYFSTLSFQESEENRVLDRTAEQALKKSFKDFVKEVDFLNLKGSSTLKQKIQTNILDTFETSLKGNKNTRVSGSKYSRHTKTTATLKTRATSKTKVTDKKKTKKTVRTTKAKKGVASSPLALIQAINKKLPATIAKNMHSPALNYRTGRFANSVRVVDAHYTAQGFLSFGYTYMKGPYQTFEPGYAQGSVNRDPRRIIDRSMREVAAEMAIGRFYTRRL